MFHERWTISILRTLRIAPRGGLGRFGLGPGDYLGKLLEFAMINLPIIFV